MKVSELIHELQAIQCEHGDVPVVCFDGAVAYNPEVFVAIHRTGNRVFISQVDPNELHLSLEQREYLRLRRLTTLQRNAEQT